jgi:hypothetical protein
MLKHLNYYIKIILFIIIGIIITFQFKKIIPNYVKKKIKKELFTLSVNYNIFQNSNIKNCKKFLNINNFSIHEIGIFGHIYGSPYENNTGIYPNFKEHIKNKNFNYSFYTGDLIRNYSTDNKMLIKDILNINNNFFIAPGNHDVGLKENKLREKYLNLFGKKFYDYEIINDSLFVVLDTNLSPWDLDKIQFEWFKKILFRKKYKQIFILTHHVIWKSYFNFKIIENSSKNKPKNDNFYKIDNLIKKLDTKIYLIAGDVGAFNNGSEFFCSKKNNLHFIASGMGNYVKDNYLVLKYDKNKKQYVMSLNFF